MMIPLGDGKRRFGFPYMTMTLIIINLLVFIYEGMVFFSASGSEGLYNLFLNFGSVPYNITHQHRLGLFSVFTSMFLHGDPFHISGNMLFLWVFGRKVEDLTGPFSFLLFYLMCGVGADVASTFARPESAIPSIGASGAISGIMAAYIVFYPGQRVRTLLLVGPIPLFPRIPAVILLGFWFLMQSIYIQLEVFDGVNYWAHFGGGITGVASIYLFLRKEILFYRHRPRSR